MRSAGSGNWTARHEVERLTQLRADVESAVNRYITECLREALARNDSDEERWMRAAGNAEALRDAMLMDVDRWIERCCKDQQDVPGCS